MRCYADRRSFAAFGGVARRGIDEKMTCEVVTIVMRVEQDRQDPEVRSFPGTPKNATRRQPLVIVHLPEGREGVKNGRFRGYPHWEKSKGKVPSDKQAGYILVSDPRQNDREPLSEGKLSPHEVPVQ